MEDMRYLHGGYAAMLKANKEDADVSWLKAPSWLKTKWVKEQYEVDNPSFSVSRKRDGFIVVNNTSGATDILDFWEGINWRLFKRIPSRFYGWHETHVRRIYRARNRELIKEMRDATVVKEPSRKEESSQA